LGEVRADDLQALVDRLIGAGHAGSTVRNAIVPLQSLYRRHRRQVTVDPSADLDLPEPGKRRERVADPKEAAALLAALPEELRAVWATPLYCGLRLGEERALRVCDVKDDGNDVHVLHVESGWDVKAGRILPKSKAGIRQIPIPGTLRTIIVAHIERTGRTGDDLLFGRTASSPFTDSHVRKQAREAWANVCTCGHTTERHADDDERRCQRRGCTCERFKALAPIGFHEARHSYSTYLDAAGISETRADRYMGHANPSVANRYRHQLAGQLADDAARLDEYLRGASAGKVVPMTAALPVVADAR
jgi:integrase